MDKKETAAERLERMKREKEAAKQQTKDNTDLVGQLTHESNGEPDFEELAEKLKKRQDEEKEGSVLSGAVKYTIYIDSAVAEAFQALCLKRGDQRRYANEAFRDFVQKKARELGM